MEEVRNLKKPMEAYPGRKMVKKSEDSFQMINEK